MTAAHILEVPRTSQDFEVLPADGMMVLQWCHEFWDISKANEYFTGESFTSVSDESP